MQEKDIVEHFNVECHMFACRIDLLTIVQPKHIPHNSIKHINAKIFESTLTLSVTKLH